MPLELWGVARQPGCPSLMARPLQDVINEIATQYDADLGGRKLLRLVFDTDADLNEFVALMRAAKPGMAEFIVATPGPVPVRKKRPPGWGH